MYLEITVLWARIIEIKSLSLELTFLHFPPIEINFKNWAWISSNSRQLCLSMGRNYRCWIVGGLRARAPVKCLCFPPCLPSKDLHILTHYGVLWSWSAWLPQPAITLIASKKLKSFKALWPHSWGENVCLFLSVSLPFSLPLSFCSCGLCVRARDIVAPVFTARVCGARRKTCMCDAEALFVSPCLRYLLLSHIHVKALNGRSFQQLVHSLCTINCVCFLFLLPSHTHADMLSDWLPFH